MSHQSKERDSNSDDADAVDDDDALLSREKRAD
jgi:hypothetical protein